MQDDPEKRISDLERGLAQPRAAEVFGEFTTSDRLTAEEVRTVAFSKPPLSNGATTRTRLTRFSSASSQRCETGTQFGGLTAADLHNVAFSKPAIGKRGYNEDEVNAFVERVKIEFSRYGR